MQYRPNMQQRGGQYGLSRFYLGPDGEKYDIASQEIYYEYMFREVDCDEVNREIVPIIEEKEEYRQNSLPLIEIGNDWFASKTYDYVLNYNVFDAAKAE